MMHTLLPFIFPEMAVVRQNFFRSEIRDADKAVRSALDAVPGQIHSRTAETVAVCVGSRNIDNLQRVVDHCLRFLEQRGFRPFIVPAMGSHGGATAAGQTAVLAKYQITEASMHVPIAADMETRCVAEHPAGFNLYVSEAALSADHMVIINRVKPHTKFKADIESGLCKLLTVGLGKHTGAAEFHRNAVRHTFKIIEESAAILLKRLNLLFGVALLEDSCGQLARIETVLPDHLIEREKMLLKDAADMMGRIPFDRIDILIIDEFGKDISGIGMDSNVTGRHRDLVGDICIAPHVKRIFVRDLSPASDGNGNGIGLADFTTKRLVDRLDREKTYVNAITAISPEKAAIPIHFETDRQCLDACVRTTGVAENMDLRVVRIKSTAAVEFLQVSRTLEDEVLHTPGVSRVSPWQKVLFTESGNLTAFYPDD